MRRQGLGRAVLRARALHTWILPGAADPPAVNGQVVVRDGCSCLAHRGEPMRGDQLPHAELESRGVRLERRQRLDRCQRDPPAGRPRGRNQCINRSWVARGGQDLAEEWIGPRSFQRLHQQGHHRLGLRAEMIEEQQCPGPRLRVGRGRLRSGPQYRGRVSQRNECALQRERQVVGAPSKASRSAGTCACAVGPNAASARAAPTRVVAGRHRLSTAAVNDCCLGASRTRAPHKARAARSAARSESARPS